MRARLLVALGMSATMLAGGAAMASPHRDATPAPPKRPALKRASVEAIPDPPLRLHPRVVEPVAGVIGDTDEEPTYGEAEAPVRTRSSKAHRTSVVRAPTLPDDIFAAAVGDEPPPLTLATSGRYPHLRGDLDSNPVLLARLERLAVSRGETWTVTSGRRSYAEQAALYRNAANNPFPVARPGTSSHETGNAADVLVGGRPIQDVIPRAELAAARLAPLAGDAVHIDLPGA